MTHTPYLVADIRIKEQQGCFHASSQQIPGFHLCGNDVAAVIEDMAPAIEFFMRHTQNIDVKVERAETPLVAFKRPTPAKQEKQVQHVVMTQAFAFA